MPNPVVHFEVHSQKGKESKQFFADLFDWHVDSSNPMDYGVVDTHTEGAGINGGVTQAQPGAPNMVTFYVEVDDLQAYLDKAESLGGTTVMPVTEIPNFVTLALFSEPGGNTIGLVKSES